MYLSQALQLLHGGHFAALSAVGRRDCPTTNKGIEESI
jgi:hypothetical protein